MPPLVADYGTDSNDDSENEIVEEKPKEEKARLPPPNFHGKIKNSVFVNPFLEAENAKLAILEKHVKMVPLPTQKELDRMCKNWKNGFCRLGRDCKHYHPVEFMRPIPSPSLTPQSTDRTSDEDEPPMKKRHGLAEGLIPGKRVMAMYRRQQHLHRY